MHPISYQRIKHLIHVVFTLILSFALLFMVQYDLIILVFMKSPELTTHGAITTVLVRHIL